MSARLTGLGGSLAALVAAAVSAGSTAAPANGSGATSAVEPIAVRADQPAASPLRLFAADSGRTMTLPVGTVLRMDLDANYSTGAEWQRRDAFGAVLESVPCEGIVREPLVKRGEPAPPVGTGSTAHYCFRAAAPGRAFLYLFYGRAWDAEGVPWANFRLDVTVTPAD